MSISPIILVHSTTLHNQSRRILNYNQSLQRTLDRFSKALLSLGQDFTFKVENKIQNDSAQNTKARRNFAEVIVNFPNGDMERIYITIQKDRSNMLFIVAPSSPSKSYSINKNGENAKLRTIALKFIVQTLFSITRADIAVTTSDVIGNYPTSPKRLVVERIPHSRFSILRRNIFQPVENAVSNGGIKVAHLNNGLTDVSWSVTDQPFATSGYNSSRPHDRPSPARAFNDAVAKLVHKQD